MSFRQPPTPSKNSDRQVEAHRIKRQKAANAALGKPDAPVESVAPLWSPEREMAEKEAKKKLDGVRPYRLSDKGRASIAKSNKEHKSGKTSSKRMTEEQTDLLKRLRAMEPIHELVKRQAAVEKKRLEDQRRAYEREREDAIRQCARPYGWLGRVALPGKETSSWLSDLQAEATRITQKAAKQAALLDRFRAMGPIGRGKRV